MDFDFSDQQYMFQESIRDFLNDNHSLSVIRDAKNPSALEAGLRPSLNELGIFSILVPEENGGLGLNLIDLALIVEEFGRALVPASAVETLAVTDLIGRFGTEAQKAALLPKIASGDLCLTSAVYEAGSGYAADGIAATAKADGSGWRISGQKIMAAFADSSDLIAIAVQFDGTPGIVLVEPGRAGITLSQHETLDLTSRYFQIDLADVAIAKVDILGETPGAEIVLRLTDVLATLAALQLVGISAKVLEISVEYAGQRVQFDKPIGSFQAIKHKCSNMAVQIESSRSAAYFAAWAVAEDAPERAKAVSMAKAYCSDTSRFACNEGLQIHGGMGFTWELGLHYYTRRAKVLETSFGNADFHRERVLSEALTELAGAN